MSEWKKKRRHCKNRSANVSATPLGSHVHVVTRQRHTRERAGGERERKMTQAVFNTVVRKTLTRD